MCSVNDDDGVEVFEKCQSNEPLETKCRKCLIENGNVVLREKDVYCKNCFMPMVTHKFRAALGKSKLVNKGERTLVCVSGSLSSVSLLHLVWTGLQLSTHKRLTLDPVIVYIDESMLFNYPKDQQNRIQELFEKYDLPYHIVSFATVLYADDCLNNDTNIDHYNGKLQNVFNNILDLTLKEDMLMKLRKHAIIKLARLFKCTRILTAENEHKLSIRLLSNVALGRGSQIALDIGLSVNDKNVDNDSSLITIRPLRNFSAKEISYYVLFNKLEDFVHSNFLTATNEDESIQKTTEEFVNNLQVDFPSTVSTIFRTGEKISEKTSATAYCLLCQGIMEVDMPPSSAMQATMYSKYVSLMGVKALELSLSALKDKEPNITSCNGCNCKNSSKEMLIKNLCYACRHIIQNLDTLDDLPSEILNKEKEKLQFKEMEEQIKEFLL